MFFNKTEKKLEKFEFNLFDSLFSEYCHSVYTLLHTYFMVKFPVKTEHSKLRDLVKNR